MGNIANNAYNTAKIQRRLGIEADVICFDYYHIMSCPEWEDSGFEGSINDPFKPDWWSVDLKNFKRPRWFAQGPVDQCRKYLMARNSQSITEKYWYGRMTFSRWSLVSNITFSDFSFSVSRDATARFLKFLRHAVSTLYWGPKNLALLFFRSLLPSWKKARSPALRKCYFFTRKVWRVFRYIVVARSVRFLKSMLVRLLTGFVLLAISAFGSLALLTISIARQFRLITPVRHEYLLQRIRDYRTEVREKFKSVLQPMKVSEKRQGLGRLNATLKKDAQQYMGDLSEWRALFDQYDIIQAYSVDPIRPFLLNLPNYAAYEHGTIREIPFIDNAQGRLTKASYQAAPVVFVTNSDNITAVKKMGLEPSRVVYLPHAFDETKLLRFKNEHLELSKLNPDTISLFSPSRQHWRDDNPSMSKRNDKFIRAFAVVARDDERLKAKMVAWGEDLEKSKSLIDQLGISDRVSWIDPLKKRELWIEYLKCHAVVDQFLIPAIGGVAFEAMTLGKRVLTSIDIDQNREFFGEPPVMLHCTDQVEIESRIREILADPTDLKQIGAAATEWMIQYHSSQRVFDLQLAAYRQILESCRSAA